MGASGRTRIMKGDYDMLLRSMLVLSLLGGCALTTATPLTEDNPNPSGFVVNGTTTKLVAAGDQLVPVSFPDPCSRYAVSFWGVLAKNESTLKVNTDGTLQEIAVNLDSTEVPIKLIEVAGDLVGQALNPVDQTSGEEGTGSLGPSLVVYGIECDADGQARLVLEGVADASSSAAPTGGTPAPIAPAGDTSSGDNVSVVD